MEDTLQPYRWAFDSCCQVGPFSWSFGHRASDPVHNENFFDRICQWTLFAETATSSTIQLELDDSAKRETPPRVNQSTALETKSSKVS